MKPAQTSLPLSLTNEVRIQPDLAIACYGAGRDVFNAFILWLELRCFNQQLAGKGYLSGQLPYLDTLAWLIARGERKTRVDKYLRTGIGTFFEIESRPKAPLFRLIGFERVCRHFRVIPLAHWRRLLP